LNISLWVEFEFVVVAFSNRIKGVKIDDDFGQSIFLNFKHIGDRKGRIGGITKLNRFDRLLGSISLCVAQGGFLIEGQNNVFVDPWFNLCCGHKGHQLIVTSR
jgi:hypothetical protein